MREQRIIVEPFELLDILQCNGEVGVGFHGYMKIEGHISADKEDAYRDILSKESWATVNVYDEDGINAELFSGIITEGGIRVDNGVKTLFFVMKTGSFLMDLEEHTRTFQNVGLSYDKVMDTLLSGYPSGSFIMCSGKGGSIGKFLCQYRETDWQFARRVASGCGVDIIANYIGVGEKVYFGLPSGRHRGNINPTEYEVIQADGGVRYSIRSREMFDVGDRVTFQGQPCYIVYRETKVEAGELTHIYTLTTVREQKQSPLYNDRLRGVSLEAFVTDVAKTNVQVSIVEDENKPACGNKWFSYATVYSSPGGTGWYCMPEKGDSVMVYFPSDREDEAYVLHSIHMASTDSAERVNPDYKSFMNTQGKEILFKPNSILFTNNAGMSLELSDEEGISLISDKKITIQSEKAIEITSVKDKIDLIASKQILLKQGSTDMVLADGLSMRGAKIRLD